MKKQSAGLLVYRMKKGQIEVLIAHPGGPFFVKQDDGVWSIPKGLYEDSEDTLTAAKREFEEEIGFPAPASEYIELGEIKRKDGKYIRAWAVEGDIDAENISSNSFELEWPPKSGKKQSFPEIDRAKWSSLSNAARKLQSAQVEFLERLANKLGQRFGADEEETESSQQTLL